MPGGGNEMGGTVIDVAIGIVLLFLISSLVASAVVEAIGGFFHRRAKHLWDAVDLMLGNTSPGAGSELRRVVDEVYQQPFITELVRPKERSKLHQQILKSGSDQASTTATPTFGVKLRDPVTYVRKAAGDDTQHGDSKPVSVAQRARRFYGPKAVDSKQFAKALLDVVRPGGAIDGALSELGSAHRGATAGVPVENLTSVLDRLDQAAKTDDIAELASAVKAIRAAGATVDSATLEAQIASMRTIAAGLVEGPVTIAEVKAGLPLLPSDLRKRLASIVGEAGDSVEQVRAEIEAWYERHMDAVSSWYRKQTRYFLFIAGLVLAGVANIDAVHATTTLYRDEGARAALVDVAEEVSAAPCDKETQQPPGTEDGSLTEAQERLDCVRETIGGSINFPIGWTDAASGKSDWVLRIVGWLFVAVAVTLGAPFWYDLLRRGLAVRRNKSGNG